VKPFVAIAVVMFTFVAILHVRGILQRWEVIIGGVVIPMWASHLGLIIAGGLAPMLRENRFRGSSRKRKSFFDPFLTCLSG